MKQEAEEKAQEAEEKAEADKPAAADDAAAEEGEVEYEEPESAKSPEDDEEEDPRYNLDRDEQLLKDHEYLEAKAKIHEIDAVKAAEGKNGQKLPVEASTAAVDSSAIQIPSYQLHKSAQKKKESKSKKKRESSADSQVGKYIGKKTCYPEYLKIFCKTLPKHKNLT